MTPFFRKTALCITLFGPLSAACGDPNDTSAAPDASSTPSGTTSMRPSPSGTSPNGQPSGSAPTTAAPVPTTPVVVPMGDQGSPNLFAELSGKSQSEIDSKVTTAINRFFGIGTNESETPSETGYRCYYELASDNSMAYIMDINNNDVRSEGMSYGMMFAVQMDLHTEFDKLWKFAKTKMQYGASPYAAWKNYFRWQGRSTGADFDFGTATPAPDGEEYIAATLYLADKRWGSSGAFNYKQEADNITTSMLHNSPSSDGRQPLIHASQNMVVFVPFGSSNEFTDPSYHVPAFYEMFAAYGPAADSAKWRSVAETSRAFLVKSAHSSTGLHPDYASFQGAPSTPSGQVHDQFQYDAWRVVMNMAMDYAWFSQDARMKTQVTKYHTFFSSYLGNNNVTQALFKVDGSAASGGSSTALTATLGAAAMASDAANRATYVNNLWGVAQQQGKYRYYEEVVYLLGLLNAAGKYHYSW